MLYRCLTGETPPDAIERKDEDTLKPARAFGISAPVDAALMAALALQASDRTQTIDAFRDQLRDPSAPPPEPPSALESPPAPVEPPREAAERQAQQRQPGQRFRDPLRDGGEGPEMVVIPAGRFRMGSNDGRDNEKPPHEVTISQAFALGRTEVTFDDYDRFCAATGRSKPNDQGWGRGTRPVINVSWDDAQAYARWLSEQTGKTYRLSTEAEWEYAARAGTATAYWWGNQASRDYANYGKDDCCDGFAQGRDRWEHTAPVGSFPANAFGLHDMNGNVWEWVFDVYASYTGDAKTDPVVKQGGSFRVVRGGSWNYTPRNLRSANRSHYAPGSSSNLGFRLARTL